MTLERVPGSLNHRRWRFGQAMLIRGQAPLFFFFFSVERGGERFSFAPGAREGVVLGYLVDPPSMCTTTRSP